MSENLREIAAAAIDLVQASERPYNIGIRVPDREWQELRRLVKRYLKLGKKEHIYGERP